MRRSVYVILLSVALMLIPQTGHAQWWKAVKYIGRAAVLTHFVNDVFSEPSDNMESKAPVPPVVHAPKNLQINTIGSSARAKYPSFTWRDANMPSINSLSSRFSSIPINIPKSLPRTYPTVLPSVYPFQQKVTYSPFVVNDTYMNRDRVWRYIKRVEVTCELPYQFDRIEYDYELAK